LKSSMLQYASGPMLLVALCGNGANAQPLRDLADAAGLLIGSYDTGLDWDDRPFPIWEGPSAYATTLSREFNTVVINVSLPTMQPERGQFFFDYADSAIAFAKANNMKVIGHHLLWGAGFPEGFWVADPARVPCTPDSLYAILENHIRTIVKRYAGDIYAYSAVNEELVFGTTSWDISSWRRCVGEGFIDSVFVWARDEDRNVKLYYNETDAEGSGSGLIGQRSDAVYERISKMVTDGIPIDGVGMQMHVSLGGDPFSSPRDLAGVQDDFSRYADLGLDVFITEIDVSITYGTGSLSEKLQQQGKVYADLLRTCLGNGNCGLFNVWGLADPYSWVFYAFPDANIATYPDESPLLFDSQFIKKPAYDSLVVVFRSDVPTAVKDEQSILPSRIGLEQNYPNPFNPTTTISFDLPKATEVTLRIYNLAGQTVVTLAKGRRDAGRFQAHWDGKNALGQDVSSGVYIYQLKAGGIVLGKKLLRIR
jgi:endo-1,4-beta-xylanase